MSSSLELPKEVQKAAEQVARDGLEGAGPYRLSVGPAAALYVLSREGLLRNTTLSSGAESVGWIVILLNHRREPAAALQLEHIDGELSKSIDEGAFVRPLANALRKDAEGVQVLMVPELHVMSVWWPKKQIVQVLVPEGPQRNAVAEQSFFEHLRFDARALTERTQHLMSPSSYPS